MEELELLALPKEAQAECHRSVPTYRLRAVAAVAAGHLAVVEVADRVAAGGTSHLTMVKPLPLHMLETAEVLVCPEEERAAGVRSAQAETLDCRLAVMSLRVVAAEADSEVSLSLLILVAQGELQADTVRAEVGAATVLELPQLAATAHPALQSLSA